MLLCFFGKYSLQRKRQFLARTSCNFRGTISACDLLLSYHVPVSVLPDKVSGLQCLKWCLFPSSLTKTFLSAMRAQHCATGREERTREFQGKEAALAKG